LRAFCASVPELEAAYVCAVENIYDNGETVQALRFSMQLKGPVVTSDDSRALLLEVAPRLGSEHPDLMRELGCGVLGDAAIAVWEENALQIY
jgi:biotin carboxylase